MGLGLTSCIDDSFTTDPNDVLTFSVDTVKFDTVMTTKGTATKQFVIYNRSKNIHTHLIIKNAEDIPYLDIIWKRKQKENQETYCALDKACKMFTNKTIAAFSVVFKYCHTW